jgi:hypothetical protein
MTLVVATYLGLPTTTPANVVDKRVGQNPTPRPVHPTSYPTSTTTMDSRAVQTEGRVQLARQATKKANFEAFELLQQRTTRLA